MTTDWEETRRALLDAFFVDLHALAVRAGIPNDRLPKTHDDLGIDCIWMDIEGPLIMYACIYRERDRTTVVKRTPDLQDMLEYVLHLAGGPNIER